MVKRPPEKLSAALRANLKRRKQPQARRGGESGSAPPAVSVEPGLEKPDASLPKN